MSAPRSAPPAVSVIMPVHNAAETIEAAARSILAGSFGDIELVVVDDGSTDGSAARIESLAGDDARIRLLQRPHQGVAAAANAAVSAARSRLIARMDADDLAHPERLAEQVAMLERDELDIVGSQVRIIDADGQPVASMARYARWVNALCDHEAILAARFIELPMVNPTLLGRREAFELGFRSAADPAAAFPEDYDWFLRAAAAGFRVGKVREPLLDWTDAPTRLTRSSPNYTADAFDRCRRAHLRSGPLADVDAVDLWGAGKTGKPWLQWLQRSGLNVRVVYEIDPAKVGERIHGCPVRHPNDMPAPDGVPLLIAVGAEGARETIRPQLEERGYSPGRDAWFVA